jgi:hypothetical protein
MKRSFTISLPTLQVERNEGLETVEEQISKAAAGSSGKFAQAEMYHAIQRECIASLVELTKTVLGR